MSICCKCKKEALLMPYVCTDCLSKLNKPNELEKEIKRMRQCLEKASQILKNKGFEEEGKAIDCMFDLKESEG